MQQTGPNELYIQWISHQVFQSQLTRPSNDYDAWYIRATMAALQASVLTQGRPSDDYTAWLNETVGPKFDELITQIKIIADCVSDNQIRAKLDQVVKVEVENEVPVRVEHEVKVHVENEYLPVRNRYIHLEEVEFPEPLFVLAAEKDVLGHSKKFECEITNEPKVHIEGQPLQVDIANQPIRVTGDEPGSNHVIIDNFPEVQHVILDNHVVIDNHDPITVTIDPESTVNVVGYVDANIINSVTLPVDVVKPISVDNFPTTVTVDNGFSDPIPICQLIRTLEATDMPANNVGGTGVFRELSTQHPLPSYQVGPDNGEHHLMASQGAVFPRAVTTDGYVWADSQYARLPDVYLHEVIGGGHRTVISVKDQPHE